MLVGLMLFCAAGAVFLIGLSAYTEFRDVKASKNRVIRNPTISTHHR